MINKVSTIWNWVNDGVIIGFNTIHLHKSSFFSSKLNNFYYSDSSSKSKCENKAKSVDWKAAISPKPGNAFWF